MQVVIYILLFIIFLSNCTDKTIYSGKIINQENLSNINFSNKNDLINKLGEPSFIDPIQNKIFYFSEKKIKHSIYNKKIDYSYLFVFELDSNNKIISSNVYDLKNKDELKLVKDQTESQVIERGLIEKIFGGVGPDTQLPTSP